MFTNMYTNMCVQICVYKYVCTKKIFKYSNLIKTKKIIKTENQKTFYIFDRLLQKEANE